MLNINARTGRAFDVQFLLFFFGHLLKFVLAVEYGLDKVTGQTRIEVVSIRVPNFGSTIV